MPYLEQLRFHLVGYGCTTCIGNSGPCLRPCRPRSRRESWWSARCCRGTATSRAASAGSAGELPRVPPLVVAYALAGRIDLDVQSEALGRAKDGKPSTSATLAVRQGSGRRGPLVHQVGDVPQAVRRGLYGPTSAGAASGSRGRSVRLGAEFDLHPPGAVLRRHAANAGPGHGHPAGAGAVPLGRQHHHGPHLARRVHPQDQPCRPAPDRPRVKPRTSTPTRPPRQPRGDGARHVRQRTTQEPARAGDGGPVTCTSPTASR